METADLVKQNPLSINDNNRKEVWSLIQDALRAEYGEETYKSWLSKLELQECSDHYANFVVPTRFVRDWILTHFEKKIIKIWRKNVPSLKKISISVVSKPKNTKVSNDKSTNISRKNLSLNNNTDSLENYLDQRFIFDNFIVGPSNEFAYAAARAVAETKSAQPGSNPLFLYGGVGLGKTHLMHAIAWHSIKSNSARRVVYISAEKFMYQFINALRSNNIMQFKQKYRSVDILMVDDIQFICGKNSTQEEFFHILNTLIDNNKQIVISGDRSPSDLENMEDRIKSRLGWGLVADIHNTTYELRLGILQAKVEFMQVMIPHKILEFLASKITSNVRELEGALNKIIAHMKLTGQEMNLENTQEILRDLLRSNEKVITIEEIQKKVAERYNLKVSDMYSSRRARIIARPRQIAMYLSKHFTDRSLAEIGRKFGGKDHTTVMHAVKIVDNLMNKNTEFSEDIRLLIRGLEC
jgi:chromosomal replication initiator protein